MTGNGIPKNVEVDAVVSMGQPIPHGDNLAPRDLSVPFHDWLREAIASLTDQLNHPLCMASKTEVC